MLEKFYLYPIYRNNLFIKGNKNKLFNPIVLNLLNFI